MKLRVSVRTMMFVSLSALASVVIIGGVAEPAMAYGMHFPKYASNQSTSDQQWRYSGYVERLGGVSESSASSVYGGALEITYGGTVVHGWMPSVSVTLSAPIYSTSSKCKWYIPDHSNMGSARLTCGYKYWQ